MIEDGIKSLHEKLINKELTSDELVKKSIDACHSIQEKTNSFVTIIDEAKGEKVTDDLLSGIPYGIKDIFATKGILSTGSSNTLNDYIPIYTATCVANLTKHGAVGVAKTVLDELGMGGTGTTGHTGVVHNPWDYDRMCAGSSSGSAASVAMGVYPYALGSDTGDSVRKPAAYCGIVGYKPTYGMISRFGMYQFASSLDTVGVLTRSVEDAAIVVDAMKGKDNKDMTSWDSSNMHLLKSLDGKVKGKKLFYIKEVCDIENYKKPNKELVSHLDNFKETIKKCESLGMSVEGVSIDKTLLNALPSVYVVISCAEATSNMSNLTGIAFGPRGKGETPFEMMTDHRTHGFSPLIKRRFVIGSYVLQSENQEKYFLNAKRVRRMIVDKMNSLFEEYDAMIAPVGVGPAKYLDNDKNMLSDDTSVLDELLQIGNYGGYPSITIPNGFIDKLPVGVNITGKVKDDENVLNIAYSLEGTMNYKNQIAKEVK
ncbi:MAG: Asp-tRNA(Asn)/Glu-tRNA(Gln) amidotransferase subunit GatA [Bacilli bacterium]|nr:Asp-tRNA(Asn)/Glu-tRNA(Gln) amidotransferase subunit GatA [Bacilli bacterium]